MPYLRTVCIQHYSNLYLLRHPRSMPIASTGNPRCYHEYKGDIPGILGFEYSALRVTFIFPPVVSLSLRHKQPPSRSQVHHRQIPPRRLSRPSHILEERPRSPGHVYRKPGRVGPPSRGRQCQLSMLRCFNRCVSIRRRPLCMRREIARDSGRRHGDIAIRTSRHQRQVSTSNNLLAKTTLDHNGRSSAITDGAWRIQPCHEREPPGG